MGDRPGSPSWVRMSEDKVCRKDLCGSVRAVYVLEKLPDVSGPGLVEAGHYNPPWMHPLMGSKTIHGPTDQKTVSQHPYRFWMLTYFDDSR